MHQIDINVILWIQTLGDWLKMPMQFFSFLGTQYANMLLMCVMYWCVDNRLGIRLAVSLMISNSFNTCLKWLFKYPRPYWVDARVHALSLESSFGLPSGHAMISTTVWGNVILWFRQRWITILLVTVLIFIGFSRLYLGVHFLSDVLAGWIFAFILLFILQKIEKPVLTWLSKMNLVRQLCIFFISSLIIVAFFLTFYWFLSDWQIPESWIMISRLTAPGSSINPFKIKDIIMISGTWFGFLSGFFWIKHLGGFNITGTLWMQIFRIIIGIFGLLFFTFTLSSFIPDGIDWVAYSLIYLQYALIGFWVTGFAPYIFIKVRLVKKKID